MKMKLNYINKVIFSCNTFDQCVTASNWILNLSKIYSIDHNSAMLLFSNVERQIKIISLRLITEEITHRNEKNLSHSKKVCYNSSER